MLIELLILLYSNRETANIIPPIEQPECQAFQYCPLETYKYPRGVYSKLFELRQPQHKKTQMCAKHMSPAEVIKFCFLFISLC